MTISPPPPAVLEQTLEAPKGARRRVPVALVAALAVVVAAEMVVRALAPTLPEPIDWPQRIAGVMAAQMQDVARTEGPVDVVFLGSSAAHNAFEPDVMRAATGARAYNAGLQRAGIASIEAWTREMVVPTLRPKVAVIAVTSRDLNDNGTLQTAHLDEYLRTPGRARIVGAETLSMKAERAAARASYLVRYRRYLRRPADLADDVLRNGSRLEPPVALGAHGEPRGAEVDARYHIRQWPFPHRNGELYGFDMRKSAVTLRAMIAELQRGGVRVALVDMPVMEDVYTAYHPRGRADLDAYRATVRAVARDLNVPLVDATAADVNEARWRVDDLHLNRVGAVRMTRFIARELISAGLLRN